MYIKNIETHRKGKDMNTHSFLEELGVKVDEDQKIISLNKSKKNSQKNKEEPVKEIEQKVNQKIEKSYSNPLFKDFEEENAKNSDQKIVKNFEEDDDIEFDEEYFRNLEQNMYNNSDFDEDDFDEDIEDFFIKDLEPEPNEIDKESNKSFEIFDIEDIKNNKKKVSDNFNYVYSEKRKRDNVFEIKKAQDFYDVLNFLADTATKKEGRKNNGNNKRNKR